MPNSNFAKLLLELKERDVSMKNLLKLTIGRDGRFAFTLFVLPLLVVLTFSQFAYGERQIRQFGITWTFDKDYPVGQFANGDFWVVGPVTIVGIDPPSVEKDGRIANGSMVNPSPRLGQTQGYDSAMYGGYVKPGNYDPSLNVARPNGHDLSADNPLTVPAGCSLVSTISTLQTSGRTQLQTAAVLTVLGEPAPEGSFRPPYAGTDKTVRFNKSRLNYSLLGNLTSVPGVPALSTVERYFERPWLDHVPGWLGGYHHPADNMPDYGRDIATEVGVGALMLNLNFSNQQKETLLVRYVQLGVDLYGIVRDGGEKNWINNGGHASGRKWPILFAGLVLNDPNMKNIGRPDIPGYGTSEADYVHFGEDDQTFYVAQVDVDATHSPQWNPDSRDALRIPYEAEDIGLPEWAIVHTTDPYRSNKFWETAYREVNGSCWAGFILAAHIVGAEKLWNHDVLFDYMDRYMQIETRYRQTSKFVENMWDVYRSAYGPVWTMFPTLRITADGGWVAKVPDKAAYNFGERVRLRAVAEPGYAFTGWSGDLSGTANPVAIVMDADWSIIANFDLASTTSAVIGREPGGG
jgi:Divergent InlB B-repeat domain